MARPFDPLELVENRYPELKQYLDHQLSAENKDILNRLDILLGGYKSAYALEILATADYIRHERPTFTEAEIVAEAKRWSPRKQQLLKPKHVSQALERLRTYEEEL
jgi:hypothetical protein